MKKSGVWLSLLAATFQLHAQVSVEVRLEQAQFISKEAMPVAVRIVNHSGQTLRLGKDPDWLTFSIEASDGFVVVQTERVPVIGEFELESSKVAVKHVDLGPYFAFARVGQFGVTATVKIKDWDTAEISSDPARFAIVRGTKIWEQTFGVPLASSTNHSAPEIRKYVLQQANYSRQLKLYARITDEFESRVVKVVPIGPMVSFSRPEPQIDQFSNLHVIYQSAARRYLYSIIDPQGEITLRQSFDVTSTRPHLHVDSTGRISVIDGERHISDDDIPRAPEQVLSHEVLPK